MGGREMSSLEAARDLIVIGGVGLAGYLVWDWYNKSSNHVDPPGTQYTNYYVPSPDTAFIEHPFNNTILDPSYDAGWNYMGQMRGITNDYANMKGLDYWFSWMKGGI
jgi:hypothetical protein